MHDLAVTDAAASARRTVADDIDAASNCGSATERRTSIWAPGRNHLGPVLLEDGVIGGHNVGFDEDVCGVV